MTVPSKSSSRILSFLFIIIALALVLISFRPVLTSGFSGWDEDTHLLQNLTVRDLNLEKVKEIFTQRVNEIYIPLTTLSYALEYKFFKYNPFIYHLDNLILHVLVVVFIYLIARRLGISALGSALAALIFGIHPMHVESVAWIVERKDVLYAFFYLLALLLYLQYLLCLREKKPPYVYLFLIFVFAALSMFAKPMALSLPIIFLVMDWFLKRAWHPKIIIEKIPLFLVVGFIGWLSYAPHARLPGNSILEAMLTWSWTAIFYLRQFLFLLNLVPIYHLPQPVSFSNPEYLLSFIAFVIIVFALIRFSQYRRIKFGFLFVYSKYIWIIFF